MGRTLTTWWMRLYGVDHILSHPETTRKLIEWAIEVSDYDIDYQPHSSINAQALADFLVETIQKEEQELWMVFMDRSTNSEGSELE